MNDKEKPVPASERSYKLNLSGEGVSIERDISESVARRIVTLVLGGGLSTGLSEQESITAEVEPIKGGLSPKLFMAGKRPTSDVERITCLAYYLTHYKNQQSFKTVELTKLNTDAAQPRLSNPTVAARNAVQRGYLALAGGGRKQVTTVGEKMVEALPDRARVKEALEEFPTRIRRRSRKSSKRTPTSA